MSKDTDKTKTVDIPLTARERKVLAHVLFYASSTLISEPVARSILEKLRACQETE
jgi:hypothetical protein